MKKSVVVILIMCLLVFRINIYAINIEEKDAIEVFDNFIVYFNNNDDKIYSIIDESNEELKNGIASYINTINISSKGMVLKENENQYEIVTVLMYVRDNKVI